MRSIKIGGASRIIQGMKTRSRISFNLGRNRKLALALLSALGLCLTTLTAAPLEAQAWGRKEYLPEPAAPEPAPDNLVPPPSEEIYFPVRADGQPFLLNIDTTINLTDSISSFYYDPKWRGEVWAPFDQVSLIERSTRLMSTWQEYDQFSYYRVLNGVNKKLERWSGFGP